MKLIKERLKKLGYILIFIISFFACKDNDNFKIEGKLTNFEDINLYAVFESNDKNQIDTVNIDPKGRFVVIHEKDESIKQVKFLMDNREKYFTVYPEGEKNIQVSGDAEYPQLIQVKGGQINNKLSEFRRKAKSLLKNIIDIQESRKTSKNNDVAQLVNIRHELRQVVYNFITENPKEKASVILLNQYFSNSEDLAQVEELLKILSPELYDFQLVKDITERVEKANATKIGKKAPNYKLKNLDGKEITPEYFTNKPYVMAFTSLSCDICREKIISLNEMKNTYKKDSLQIMLVCLDENLEQIRETIKNDTIKWNLAADSASQALDLFEKYNVNTLPTCYLIDKNGVIQLKTTNDVELRKRIEELTE